ncbi:MAG: MarR family winged helix-turn-helix transcriptional regulator [Patescibacteria group bacterium]
MHRELEFVLSKYDLTPPEWTLLGQLEEIGPLRLTKLADLLNVRMPFVSNLVATLKDKGLVEIVDSNTDKRVKIASLSGESRSKLPEIEENVLMHMTDLLNGVSSLELASYAKVLKLIAANYSED